MIAGAITRSEQLSRMRVVLQKNGLSDVQIAVIHELVCAGIQNLQEGGKVSWRVWWKDVGYVFSMNQRYSGSELSHKLVEKLVEQQKATVTVDDHQTTVTF